MVPSIIIPSIGRAARLSGLIQNIHDTTPAPCEIVVITDDADTIRMIEVEYGAWVNLVKFSGDAVEAWNAGAAQASGDWFVPMDDDCLFHPGWLDEVAATPNQGFVGLYEGYDVGFVGHWAISREVCGRVLGGVLQIPHYRSWWTDWEVCWHIRRAGLYVATKKVVMIHNHCSLGRSVMDATYAQGYARHAADGVIYTQREAAGFPIDWAPLIQENIHENIA